MSRTRNTFGIAKRVAVWALPRPALWVGWRQVTGLGTIISRGAREVLAFRRRVRVERTWDEALERAADKLNLRSEVEIEDHLRSVRAAFATKAWLCYFSCGVAIAFLPLAVSNKDFWYGGSLIALTGVAMINGVRSAFSAWQIQERRLGGLRDYLSTPQKWFPR